MKNKHEKNERKGKKVKALEKKDGNEFNGNNGMAYWYVRELRHS